MKHKVLILVFVLIVILISGCKKEVPEGCIEAGKVSENPSLGPEGYFGGCCPGLINLEGVEYEPDSLGADLNGCISLEGVGLVCSDCGNGVCENWENQCNCEKDCK